MRDCHNKATVAVASMIAGTAIVVVRLFLSRFAGTSVARGLLPGIDYRHNARSLLMPLATNKSYRRDRFEHSPAGFTLYETSAREDAAELSFSFQPILTLPSVMAAAL